LLLALVAAGSAQASRSESPDYKFATAAGQFSTGGETLYDPITFDAVEASVYQTAVEISMTSSKGLVAFGRLLVDVDPYASLHLRAENPFESEASFRYYVSMPTTRMIDDRWRAEATLVAALADGNGDGAAARPDVMVIDPANPFSRPQARFMDTGVSLVVGTSSFLGGPPVVPLGDAPLLASAGGLERLDARSGAAMLPDHDWIGPDVAWNTLYLTVAFKLSPHDRLELDARIDISEIRPVPEPATWAMWLTGAGGLLAWRGESMRLIRRCRPRARSPAAQPG
jgi:hypothetical protein